MASRVLSRKEKNKQQNMCYKIPSLFWFTLHLMIFKLHGKGAQMKGGAISLTSDSERSWSSCWWSSCCSSCACRSCHSTAEIAERPGEYSTGGDAGLSTGPSIASSSTSMVGGNWTKCPEKVSLSLNIQDPVITCPVPPHGHWSQQKPQPKGQGR